MQSLTFHSVIGTGQAVKNPKRKILVYEDAELVDNRRVPPLRRLCPCFSLWCCLPWVLILLVPSGVLIWDATRDPQRIELPPPTMPPLPPLRPPLAAPAHTALAAALVAAPATATAAAGRTVAAPLAAAARTAQPADPAPPAAAAARARRRLRADGAVCALGDALPRRALGPKSALAHGRGQSHGAAGAGRPGHLQPHAASGARLGGP